MVLAAASRSVNVPAVRPLALAFAIAAGSAVVPTGVARAGGNAIVLYRVVARVDEQTILQSDLVARARPLLAHGGERRAVLRQVLDQMINELLIAKDATRLSLTVSDDEVQSAIAQIVAQNGITPEKLDDVLRSEGVTRKSYEAEVKRELLQGKWLALKLGSKPRPTDPKELDAFVGKERDAALAVLRQGAFIDVRQ